MSLVYRGLRKLHYLDLPSARRRLQGNFSGVIAFDFSTDVVTNTAFGKGHAVTRQILFLLGIS